MRAENLQMFVEYAVISVLYTMFGRAPAQRTHTTGPAMTVLFILPSYNEAPTTNKKPRGRRVKKENM